ncbi:MAG: hypothetical protein IT161_01350 [Bryobacterales bacterium]|nr:hypothetical protein [Bryobacterales bacterium]
MNRREFAGRLGSFSAAGLMHSEETAAPTLYYVDGYHGGVRGHMPPGSWRDILNQLRKIPAWKLTFDIEPASWEVLRREDPQAYQEILEFFSDTALTARLELANGTFSQPFGWAQGGESNIRQLQRGRQVILEHFPKAVLDTYAVQEPCWASCLPQLLRSMGFKGASLKNPGTAWGGYAAGFDAEVVNWTGPDGTSIPAVPRYACEELRNVWETESVTGSVEFAKKCVIHGIVHPAGNCFQDLGWAAKPKVTGSHIRYVTWREYLQTIAAKPTQEWRFTAEDILTSLPWGEKTLQTLAQQVRSAENKVLVAEKMASLAAVTCGAAYPETRLQRAWDQLLWAQHHDVWITATTRSGRQAWAFQAAAGTFETEEICDEIVAASAELMSRGTPTRLAEPLGPQWIRVFNTLAIEREDVVELAWTCDVGTRRARVFDSSGAEIPCQLQRPRKFNGGQANRGLDGSTAVPGVPDLAAGESLNAVTLVFRAKVPAMGYSTYRVEPVYDESKPPEWPAKALASRVDGGVILETDLYRLRIDPAKGGAITSLLMKAGNIEFTDPSSERLFNEYRGYFITEKQWASSADNPARVTIVENGPVRVRAMIAGQILGRRFQTIISMAQGQRRIDLSARFTYDQETWIGDPWDIKPEDRRRERRRSSNDGRWKLQAFFPTPFERRSIYKNAAFDVCKSRNEDTFYQRWDEIKHNMVVNWVEVADEEKKLGLTVFCDHTTAYTHGPQHPLALVMGWGWEGGFWWGKCPLKGTTQVGYSLAPHTGSWSEAGISSENSRWNEPLRAQLMDGAADRGGEALSLFQGGGRGLEVPTMQAGSDHLLIRLFNAEGDGSVRTISLPTRTAFVDLVELDGRVAQRLPVRPIAGGRTEVRLALPRFGVRTLRVSLKEV